MLKHYIKTLIFILTLTPGAASFAQGDVDEQEPKKDTIEGLRLYPNPVSNGKLNITTQKNFTKNIAIFDVLGKKVLSAALFGKELNISKLNPGVYVIKIEENEVSVTRKLVVR